MHSRVYRRYVLGQAGLVPEGVAWEDLVTPWLFVAYDDIQRYYFLLPTEIDTR